MNHTIEVFIYITYFDENLYTKELIYFDITKLCATD